MPHNEDNPLPVTGPSNTTNHFLGPVGTYVHHAPHANVSNNGMTNNAPIDPAAITANSASNSNRSTTSATGTTGQATSSNQSNGMSAQSSTPNSGMNASLAPRTHIEPPQNGNIQQPLVQPFAPTRPVDPFRRIHQKRQQWRSRNYLPDNRARTLIFYRALCLNPSAPVIYQHLIP